jgi:nucleoside 2-deoxyribosyltransferase
MNYLLVKAGEIGYLDTNSLTLTLNGWRRVDELRETTPNSRQAFVAMWFAKEMDDAWLSGFKPGVEAHGYYSAVRVDSIEHNQKIDDRIIGEIRRSGLVIADFTGNRGGVYFEAGYAQGLGLPVIWTCRADYVDRLHFDTRQYNHIVWNTPTELQEKLRQRIAATVLPRKH